MNQLKPTPPRTRHARRRVSQIAVLLLGAGLPWFSIFRLDMPALRVVYLGRAYPLEWPYVLGMILPFLVVVWGLGVLRVTVMFWRAPPVCTSLTVP